MISLKPDSAPQMNPPKVRYIYRKSRLAPFFWRAGRLILRCLGVQDVHDWPCWFGELCGIDVPFPSGQPGRMAHILEKLRRAGNVPGAAAECGVYQGASLIPIAYQAKKIMPSKRIYAFDSFAGFDDSVMSAIDQSGEKSSRKSIGGFGNTSIALVRSKLRAFGLEKDVQVIPGFFEESLRHLPSERFAFVFLDCDLYESYQICLEFFYPRMNPGAVMVFDEYDDPAWPGARKAVDEFFLDKAEKPIVPKFPDRAYIVKV